MEKSLHIENNYIVVDRKIICITSVIKDGQYLGDTREDVTEKVVTTVLERNR